MLDGLHEEPACDDAVTLDKSCTTEGQEGGSITWVTVVACAVLRGSRSRAKHVCGYKHHETRVEALHSATAGDRRACP